MCGNTFLLQLPEQSNILLADIVLAVRTRFPVIIAVFSTDVSSNQDITGKRISCFMKVILQMPAPFQPFFCFFQKFRFIHVITSKRL